MGVALAAAFVVGAFVGVFVAFAVVFIAVAAGLDFSVRVGAGVDLAVGEGLVVLRVGVALALVGDGVAVGLVAVGVGVVGVGVGEPEVGEVDGPGGAADGGNGSQDSLLDVVAALAAVLVARVRLTPEAAVIKTLPAISVTVAGRACPKRMKRPTSAARRGMPPTAHQAPWKAPPAPPTRLSVRITAVAVFEPCL